MFEVFLPKFANTACGMFSSAFIGNDYKFYFIALSEGLCALDLTCMEEQLFAFVYFMAEKSVLSCN